MQLRQIQRELARNLTGLGFQVYDNPLLASANAELPAIVIGLPDDVTLQTKTRALVTMPVHVVFSTADEDDALQRLSDATEFTGAADTVLGALMVATSPHWTSVDVESISEFAMINFGANSSALSAVFLIIVHSIQV